MSLMLCGVGVKLHCWAAEIWKAVCRRRHWWSKWWRAHSTNWWRRAREETHCCSKVLSISRSCTWGIANWFPTRSSSWEGRRLGRSPKRILSKRRRQEEWFWVVLKGVRGVNVQQMCVCRMVYVSAGQVVDGGRRRVLLLWWQVWARCRLQLLFVCGYVCLCTGGVDERLSPRERWSLANSPTFYESGAFEFSLQDVEDECFSKIPVLKDEYRKVT